MPLIPAGSNREESNGANNGRVAQLWLCADNRVCNVMIDWLHTRTNRYQSMTFKLPRLLYSNKTYGMLLLLHLKHGTIFERPLYNIRIWWCSLDELATFELTPEGAELLELDQVPDVGELGFDDCRFGDRSGCWDTGCHNLWLNLYDGGARVNIFDVVWNWFESVSWKSVGGGWMSSTILNQAWRNTCKWKHGTSVVHMRVSGNWCFIT